MTLKNPFRGDVIGVYVYVYLERMQQTCFMLECMATQHCIVQTDPIINLKDLY